MLHSLDNNGLDSDLVINGDNWPLPTGLEEPGESGISEEPDVEEDCQNILECHLLLHPLLHSLKRDLSLIGLPLHASLYAIQ